MHIVYAVIAALILGVVLSLDGLTVALSIGARMHGKLTRKDYALVIGVFAAMHCFMLTAGFLLGSAVAGIVEGFAPWISFILLASAGGVMVRNAFVSQESENKNLLSIPPLRRRAVSALAIACSIDAVAVGSGLGIDNDMPFILTAVMVTVITAVFVGLGLKLGNEAGQKWEKPAEILGGVTLILLGLKSLIF